MKIVHRMDSSLSTRALALRLLLTGLVLSCGPMACSSNGGGSSGTSGAAAGSLSGTIGGTSGSNGTSGSGSGATVAGSTGAVTNGVAGTTSPTTTSGPSTTGTSGSTGSNANFTNATPTSFSSQEAWGAIAMFGSEGAVVLGQDSFAGDIVTTTNLGSAWSTVTPPVPDGGAEGLNFWPAWGYVAATPDGTTMIAANGDLWTSDNSGQTWVD